MSESEKFYDDVIAPKLLEIVAMCRERRMSTTMNVEFDRGCFAGIFMVMVTQDGGEPEVQRRVH